MFLAEFIINLSIMLCFQQSAQRYYFYIQISMDQNDGQSQSYLIQMKNKQIARLQTIINLSIKSRQTKIESLNQKINQLNSIVEQFRQNLNNCQYQINQLSQCVKQEKESLFQMKNSLKGSIYEIQQQVVEAPISVDEILLHRQNYFVAKIGQNIFHKALLMKNANKFYITQILVKRSDKNQFFILNRWGRVGVHGQLSLQGPITKQNAIKKHEQKYSDKIKSGYEQQEIQAGPLIQEYNKNIQQTKSLSFIQVFYDMNFWRTYLKKMGYDLNKMPIDKLSQMNIIHGFEKLNKIRKVLQNSEDHTKHNVQLINYSNQFYSIIPFDFGFKQISMFIINNKNKLVQKYTFMQNLSMIKAVLSFISQYTQQSFIQKLPTQIIEIPQNIDIFQFFSKLCSVKQVSNNFDLKQVYQCNQKFLKIQGKQSQKCLLWLYANPQLAFKILNEGFQLPSLFIPRQLIKMGPGIYLYQSLQKIHQNIDTKIGIAFLVQVKLGKQIILKQSNIDMKVEHNEYDTIKYQKSQTILRQQNIFNIKIFMEQTQNHNQYCITDPQKIQIKYMLVLHSNNV